MEKSWEDAIKRVLAESERPLHYKEICERILDSGYYQTDGATPAATVNARIAASIKHEGTKSPFMRVTKGIFTLREAEQLASSASVNGAKATLNTTPDNEASDSIIRSFGMYWNRDLVVWRSEPKIYGKQHSTSKSIDFCRQKGVYILYDHHTVVYVGRAIERPIGRRLSEHTIDRLNSRWNRFSWFGLLEVNDAGQLYEVPFNNTLAGTIASLEALLIEALEPPQNRKRGDDLSAIEYLQDLDQELRDREIQYTLRVIEQKLRGDG